MGRQTVFAYVHWIHKLRTITFFHSKSFKLFLYLKTYVKIRPN